MFLLVVRPLQISTFSLAGIKTRFPTFVSKYYFLKMYVLARVIAVSTFDSGYKLHTLKHCQTCM